MSVTRYGRVLANPRTRALLALGMLIRVPMFGVSVILTLHVVDALGRSWGEAGVVAAAATLAVAISGPWRGKLLDRIGLRRVVLPSVLVTAACWAVAPFVGYWPLLVLASIAGLFAVPTFTVIRQALIAATDDDERRVTLALDGIMVEFAFMLGPVLAIAASSAFGTAWVIFGLEMFSAVMAGLLWVYDPPIRAAIDEEEAGDRLIPRREWASPRFFAVCLVGFAAVVVLSGSDVAFVAAATHFDAASHLGYVLSIGALGSVVGGLVYGALPKAPPMFLLLFLLAAATVPMGAAGSMTALGAMAFVSGMFCAPTMTASVEALTRVVPEPVRGEAMGWHGSFLTLGGAVGGPLSGFFIDRHGFGGGFAAVGTVGVALAILGYGLIRVRRGLRARDVRSSS